MRRQRRFLSTAPVWTIKAFSRMARLVGVVQVQIWPNFIHKIKLFRFENASTVVTIDLFHP